MHRVSIRFYCTNSFIGTLANNTLSGSRCSWTAGNYTQFWGRPLSEGVRYKLGTFYPEEVVQVSV